MGMKFITVSFSSATNVYLPVDSPLISCPRTDAPLHQRNAYISCEIRAQPDVHTLYWIIDQNDTVLSTGQIIREYWTLVIVSSLLSILTIHVEYSLFRHAASTIYIATGVTVAWSVRPCVHVSHSCTVLMNAYDTIWQRHWSAKLQVIIL